MNDTFNNQTIHSQFSPIANSTAIKPKHIKKCDENPKQIVEYIKRTKRQVQNVTKLNFDESIESQQIKPESNEIKPNLENNLDNSNFTVLDKVLENLPDSELELTKLAYDYVTESELKLKEKMFIASQPVKVLSNSRCLKWIGVDIKQPEERELKIEIESSVIQKVVIKSMSKEFKLINQGNLTDTLETTFIPNVENNIIVQFQPKTFSFCSGILIIEFFSKKVKINLFGYACQPEVFLSEPRKLPYNSEDASINRSIEISVKNQSPRTAFVSFYDINQCNLQIFPRKFLINPNEIIQVRITFPVERYSAKYGCIFVDECIRRAAKEYYLNNRKRKNKLLNDLEIFHPFQDEDIRIFEKLPNANWIHNLNEQIEKGFISNEITLNQIKYKSIQNIHLNESTDSVKTIDVLSPNNSPTQQRSSELLINNANINALLNKIRSVYKGDLENVVIRKHEYNFPTTTVNNKTIVGILIKNFNSDLRLEWSIEDINPSNSMTVFGETRGTFSNFVTIPIQYQPVCAGRMKCEYIIRVTDPKSESYIEKLVKLFGYCTETGSSPNVLYSFQSEIPGFKVEQEILFQIPKDKSEKVVKKLTLTNMTKFQMEIFTLIDSPFQIKKNIILEVRSQSVSVHLQLNKLQNRSSKRLIFFDSDGNATITNLIVLESR